MSKVVECYSLTEQLHGLLSSPEQINDEVIVKVELLLEKRELILPDIKPPFSVDDQKYGRQIVMWNTVIDQKLLAKKNMLKRTINDLENKKNNVKKYTNPYDSIRSDGMFYDKRN
ncbi:hypothetical protein Q0N12_14610 [Rossellomorea marisflavi]|uniref:hypothetical protein n=1 Tax=Rossellomorea marisflavi TaxID=189381 RepID=UPI00345ADC79